MRWYQLEDGKLHTFASPPDDSRPILLAKQWFMPDFVSRSHESLNEWRQADLATGPIIPDRLWLNAAGKLTIRFEGYKTPRPRPAVGDDGALAAWLVLLDKWMDTFVVIARARAIWPVDELARCLPFTSPAYLPPEVVNLPPQNWERVAQALSNAVVDGPLPNIGAVQE